MDQGEFFYRKMWLFQILGDSSRMRAYADSALAAFDRLTKTTSDPSGYYEDIAVVYAARGRRAEALRAMARAEELLPPTKDMYVSSTRGNAYAAIYTLLGDKDAAISTLEKSAGSPGEITRNWLRLDPRYASLRSNPRFQRLIQQ
jgi:tetratricopeptide (TPR) repeat protein